MPINWDTIGKTGLAGGAIFLLTQFMAVTDAAKAWTELTRGPRADFTAEVSQERAFYLDMLQRVAADAKEPERSKVWRAAVSSHQEPKDALAWFGYGKTSGGSCETQCKPAPGCNLVAWTWLGRQDACLASQCAAELACRARGARIGELDAYRRAILGQPSEDRVQDIRNSFATAEATALRPRTAAGVVAGGVDPASIQAAPPAGGALPLSSLTLADNNPNGWDVDVFWCGPSPDDSAKEEARYADARLAAEQLAAVARANQTIGGQHLGRIRLRPLPKSLARRVSDNRKVSGNYIVADTDEVPMATAIQKVINARVSVDYAIPPNRSAFPSKWYLSLYTCAGVTP